MLSLSLELGNKVMGFVCAKRFVKNIIYIVLLQVFCILNSRPSNATVSIFSDVINQERAVNKWQKQGSRNRDKIEQKDVGSIHYSTIEAQTTEEVNKPIAAEAVQHEKKNKPAVFVKQLKAIHLDNEEKVIETEEQVIETNQKISDKEVKNYKAEEQSNKKRGEDALQTILEDEKEKDVLYKEAIVNSNTNKANEYTDTPVVATLDEPKVEPQKKLQSDYYVDYVVGQEETIEKIASVFHSTITTFIGAFASHADTDFIEGTHILVPVKSHKYKQGEDIKTIATKYNLTPIEIIGVNKQVANKIKDEVVLLPILDSNRKVIVHRYKEKFNKSDENKTTEMIIKPIQKPDEIVNKNQTAQKIEESLGEKSNGKTVQDSLVPHPEKKPDEIVNKNQTAQKIEESLGEKSNEKTVQDSLVPSPEARPKSLSGVIGGTGRDGIEECSGKAEEVVPMPLQRPDNIENKVRESVKLEEKHDIGKKSEESLEKEVITQDSQANIKEINYPEYQKKHQIEKEKMSTMDKQSNQGPLFIRPMEGDMVTIISGSEKKIDGVEIKNKAGSLVKAAASGKVIYVGDEIAAYKTLIIIQHDYDRVTIYGNLEKIEVEKNEYISQGQVIGRIGKTKDAKTPRLFFNVREGRKTIDPTRYLSN